VHLVQQAVGAGQNAQLITNTLGRECDVRDVRKRVKTQRLAIDVGAAQAAAGCLVGVAENRVFSVRASKSHKKYAGGILKINGLFYQNVYRSFLSVNS